MTEWKTYRLGDICDLVAGFAFKSKDFGDFPNKVVKIADIQPPVVNTNDLVGVDLSNYDTVKLSKYLVSKGDYVLAMTGATIGKLGRITDDVEAYINQRVLTFRPNESIVDKDYLYYQLCSLNFNKYILNHIDSETAQPNISAGSVGGFEISLPGLEEQQRIAGILGAIDDKIENNRRINTNLELQAQALYKQWFVDNRSDDWEVGKVSDYYDITIGKTPPRKEKQWFSNNPKDSVWVSISDMGSCGAYISDSSEYLTTKAVDKFNIKVVPNNTVLLSFKLTVGRVAISDGAMTTNEAIAHFNTLNDYLTEYTYLALKAYNFANLGSTSSIATAVNSKIIKSMLWVMPNDNVLRDFHNIVAPIFTQIKNNIRENETLATLRDTLLPKLMNGEIKL